jgi:hypothetical protein
VPAARVAYTVTPPSACDLALLSDAFGARLDRLSAPQQASLRTLLQKLN